jgi:PAS domain S-box-containing protein
MQLFLAITAVPSLLLAAVVAERRQAEAARLAGAQRYAVTLKSIGDAVIATDTRGRVELVNPVAETLTGWTNEKASGKRLEEVFHIINEDTRQVVENPVEKVIREGKVVGLANHTVLIAKGGVERPIADSGAPIRDEDNEIVGVVLVFRDQTLERAATNVLQESEQRYRAIMEQAVDAIILRNKTGRILDVNQKACQNLGYTREELLSKTVADIDPEAVRAGKQDVWDKILAGEVFTFESHQLHKDGSAFPVEVTQKLVRLPLGPAVLGIVRDITERKQAEEKLRETNRALRMISDCNQELVRATNEADLLKNICRLIVEHGGYRLAWVGFAGQDAAKSVRPAAQFGFEEGYLDTVNITWADAERGRGPVGTAIRTGQPVIARNILTDPAYGPWREAAIKRGYASSIALPLQHEDRCFGVLSLYAATPDAFDPEEVKLLSELADDLAYGIGALRHRAEQELTEGELERTAHDWQATFDATNDAIWILDNDHRVLRTNKTAERFFHRPCREMLGQHCWSIVHGTTEPHPDCPFVRARQSGHREMMELQQGELWFEVVTDPIFDAVGEYAGAVHIVSDITERKQAEKRIARQLEELQRWQEVMLGREDRVQQLKREVNELCRRMDAAARYPSQEAGPEDAAATKPNL